MAVEIKYVCDKCGHTQATDDQMWSIGIAIVWARGTLSDSNLNKKQLWCRACIEKLGLLPPKPPAVKPDPAPTLEDMIREIVREEITE